MQLTQTAHFDDFSHALEDTRGKQLRSRMRYGQADPLVEQWEDLLMQVLDQPLMHTQEGRAFLRTL